MAYRMIVMDMDGTLLDDKKKVSDRNKEALKKASQLGVKVVIATGRIFTSALVYGEMLGIDTPIIASNGAYIREKDKDEVIYSKLLGEENVREILRLCKKYDIYCHLYTTDTVYSEKLIYAAVNYSKWNKGLPEDKKVKIEIIRSDEWESVIEKDKDKILKAVVYHDDPVKIGELRKEVCRLNVEVESSFDNNFEVMDSEVSKGRAAQVLAQMYGIDKSEVICIGDNENDISMIKFAGLGVAMGNASEETKRAADYVTLTNEEDGVAHVIEKFILNTVG